MHRLIKPIFWTFLFLVMMLAIDQILVQVPAMHPAHAAVSNFYRDFRGRLTDLAFGEEKAVPKSIEAVIETKQKGQQKPAQKSRKLNSQQSRTAAAEQVKKPQRYIYSDDEGELNFTDSLDDVPEKFRGQAQPMGE